MLDDEMPVEKVNFTSNCIVWYTNNFNNKTEVDLMDFKEFLIEHESFHGAVRTERPCTVYLDNETEYEETYDLSANQVKQKPITII